MKRKCIFSVLSLLVLNADVHGQTVGAPATPTAPQSPPPALTVQAPAPTPANPAPVPNTALQQAAQAGTNFGNSTLLPSTSAINPTGPQAGMPNYNTAAQQFPPGNSSTVRSAADAKILTCKGFVPGGNVANNQECDAVNFLQKNPTTRKKVAINPATDPAITVPGGVLSSVKNGTNPLVASNQATQGAAAGQCQSTTTTIPAVTNKQFCYATAAPGPVNGTIEICHEYAPKTSASVTKEVCHHGNATVTQNCSNTANTTVTATYVCDPITITPEVYTPKILLYGPAAPNNKVGTTAYIINNASNLYTVTAACGAGNTSTTINVTLNPYIIAVGAYYNSAPRTVSISAVTGIPTSKCAIGSINYDGTFATTTCVSWNGAGAITVTNNFWPDYWGLQNSPAWALGMPAPEQYYGGTLAAGTASTGPGTFLIPVGGGACGTGVAAFTYDAPGVDINTGLPIGVPTLGCRPNPTCPAGSFATTVQDWTTGAIKPICKSTNTLPDGVGRFTLTGGGQIGYVANTTWNKGCSTQFTNTGLTCSPADAAAGKC